MFQSSMQRQPTVRIRGRSHCHKNHFVTVHTCPLQQVFLTWRQGNTNGNRLYHVDNHQGKDRPTHADISSISAHFEVITRSRVPLNRDIQHISQFLACPLARGHARLLCTVHANQRTGEFICCSLLSYMTHITTSRRNLSVESSAESVAGGRDDVQTVNSKLLRQQHRVSDHFTRILLFNIGWQR